MKAKALKDLYNKGKCFTKGREYEVGQVYNNASLIDKTVVNDLCEPHIIGMWWRNFKLVK
jgi:hypothetical protein